VIVRSVTESNRPPAISHTPFVVVLVLALLAAFTAPGSVGEASADDDAPSIWRFDFGSETSPVADGWIQVANTTLYDEDLGYGLSQVTAERDRGGPDDVRRDFVLANGYHFWVDLPDGEYHVTIISGDEIASNNTRVTVQGEDQGQLQPRNPGEFSAHELFTEVTDGQLEFHFRDDGRANGIIVSQSFPPTGLDVLDLTLTPEPAVTLGWDASAGAESYTVYRAPDGSDSFEEVGTSTELQLTDDTVELGFTYRYSVTQTNPDGIESGRSEPLTVAVLDPSVDRAETPENLELVHVNPQRIELGWDEVEDAEYYHVYRSYSPDGPRERVATTDGTTYTHEGRTELNHYYHVLAVNIGGVSDPTDPLVTPITDRSSLPPEGDLPGCGEERADARVLRTGFSWTAKNGGTTVYDGYSMQEAMQAAVDSLTPGRTSRERVVVLNSGRMPADLAVDLPSHTEFESCGVIDVTGNESLFSYEQHVGAVRIRHAEDVSVPYLSLTGNPNFGVYVRTSSDLYFGQLDLRLRGGHGVRIDSRDDDSVREVRNVRIDEVFVSGTESHGVETYGVDGISIGTVIARDTGFAGILLNDTVNADIDLVDGIGAGTGTGYAAFRTANRNGMIDGEYPTNIRVGEVRARGGGRGIFCVSESGGIDIERVDIAQTGNNAVLIENCHNVTIASEGGVIAGPAGIRIAARSEFDNTSDVTFENFTLRNSSILESPCAVNTVVRNLTLENSQIDICE
jgi:fibronectin type 3 domain-containing protein